MRSLHRHIPPVLILVGSWWAAGCDDAPTQPEVLLIAAETEAAIEFDVELPTLPRLVERVLDADHRKSSDVDSRDLEEARALWVEAESSSDEGAAVALRGAAYRLAVPGLGAALDSAEIAEILRRLDGWLAAGSAAIGGFSNTGLGDALREARTLRDQGRHAEAAGDRIAAIESILKAADHLLAVTPGGVARRLIHEAELGLAEYRAERNRESGPEGSLTAARAERLLRGAKDAFGQGEYLLAIRRAYYAGRLVRHR